MQFSVSFITLGLLSVSIQGSQIPLVDSKAPDCGIGFDLTPSYGTAAVACDSQPGKPLALVKGRSKYKSVMHELSNSLFWPPRQYTPYPRPDPPNATVVAILAHMIESLRCEVEKIRGEPVSAAAVTVPHLSQIYDTTVQAACDEIGLPYLQILDYRGCAESLVYHQNALIAGHGLGLCQPYTSQDHDCTIQQRLPSERYYLIGYYEDGIEAVLTSDVDSAYAVQPFPYAELSIGSNMRHVNPSEEYYWEEVRRFISLPMSETIARRPTRIILHGDQSGDPTFRQVVNETLQRYCRAGEPPTWVDGQDPVFAGALGAAELAERKPYWVLCLDRVDSLNRE